MSDIMKVKRKFFLMLALCVVSISAAVQAQQYMLYTEKTLAQAGVVSPSIEKAHFYEAGEVVTLTAQPYQGYEFVYWLGNVEEKTGRTTKVVMDGPRYIVAVFEPTISGEGVEYGMKSLEEGGGAGVGGGGGGDSMFNNSISSSGYSGVGSYMKQSERPGTLTQPSTPSAPSPAYRPPGEVSPNPVIPEPATLTLFGLGAAGVTFRRIYRKRKLEA